MYAISVENQFSESYHKGTQSLFHKGTQRLVILNLDKACLVQQQRYP